MAPLRTSFKFRHTCGLFGNWKWPSEVGDKNIWDWGTITHCAAVLWWCHLSRKTNKQGGTSWTEHFNPHLHTIDASMTFVYIAYGQILDCNGCPVVFGGEYQATSGTAQEAKFVDGLWLKVVCGYSSTRRNFSIITSFASRWGPEASDIPRRVVGSLAKAADIIFTDKSCRCVKLKQAFEADLAAEVHETQWPPMMSIYLITHNWDWFQKMEVVNPIFKQDIMVTLPVMMLSSSGACVSTMSSLWNQKMKHSYHVFCSVMTQQEASHLYQNCTHCTWQQYQDWRRRANQAPAVAAAPCQQWSPWNVTQYKYHQQHSVLRMNLQFSEYTGQQTSHPATPTPTPYPYQIQSQQTHKVRQILRPPMLNLTGQQMMNPLMVCQLPSNFKGQLMNPLPMMVCQLPSHHPPPPHTHTH